MDFLQRKEGQKRIIVIGGGFGGLNFCKKLSNRDVQVVLFDTANYHLFQPLLYQVATASLSATDIAQPLRAILTKRKNTVVLMEKVNHIDLDEKEVCSANYCLKYDYLVLAAGAQTNYFGNDKWRRNTIGLKSLAEARELRSSVLSAFEKAETSSDPEEQKKLLTVVIVGGGPTGVELAGALVELTHVVMRHDFRRIDPRQTRIIVAQSGDRLLPTYDPKLGEYARKCLEKMGAEVMLNSRVTEIEEGAVRIGDDLVIPAANTIWTAGVRANDLCRQLNVPKEKGDRVKVEQDCSIPGYPEAFAVGDNISLVDAKGKLVPGVAQGAIQTGRFVAEVIDRELEQGPFPVEQRRSFAYFDKGDMAVIGRYRGVLQSGPVKMRGFFAWLGWLVVHLYFLVGLQNKFTVMVQWGYAYLNFKRSARVILPNEEHDDC